MNTLRIKSVEPAHDGPHKLKIEWSDSGKSKADLTGLVFGSEHFGAFARDPAAFKEVEVVHHGTGIRWKNGLDCSADTLRMLANE